VGLSSILRDTKPNGILRAIKKIFDHRMDCPEAVLQDPPVIHACISEAHDDLAQMLDFFNLDNLLSRQFLSA
jgi:hypothetical protein